MNLFIDEMEFEKQLDESFDEGFEHGTLCTLAHIEDYLENTRLSLGNKIVIEQLLEHLKRN